MSEEGNGGGGGNPGKITVDLCEAYRTTIMTEIKALRNQILTGLAISTAILSLISYALHIARG